eukprot:SAG31_NODE_31217_length_370_cov_2.738007_1_plen_67_part_00
MYRKYNLFTRTFRYELLARVLNLVPVAIEERVRDNLNLEFLCSCKFISDPEEWTGGGKVLCRQYLS